VAYIVAKCVDTNNASVLQQLDLSGMSSLSGSLSGLTCSTLKSLILPKGTSIDGTEFGGNVMITFALSSNGTYYNAMLRNSGGNMSFQNFSNDFINLLKAKAMHLTVVGSVTQTDVFAFKDNCSAMYLNMTKATGAADIVYANYADKLYRIFLPDGMTTIPEGCLSGCSNLESVKIPEGVTEIKANAFNNCQKLTTVNLPSTLKIIGNSAFYDCHGIQSLRIPEGVTKIGTSAFRECLYLQSVVLPSTLTEIGNSAFSNCWMLKDIYLKCKAPKFIEDNGTESTSGNLMEVRSQENTDTYKPEATVDETNVTRSYYWASTPGTSTSNGNTMIHVQSGDAYDDATTNYSGYTVKERYVQTTGSESVYYAYKAADYNNGTRYPNEVQIKSAQNYSGWKAFALVDVGYDPADHEKQVPNLTDATWYTLCYPFTMTRAMIEDTFGSGTEVCNFVGVTKAKSGTTETRTIHFTSDLINPGYDTDGNLITPATTDIIEANHPYMIHPSVAPELRERLQHLMVLLRQHTAYYVRTDYNLGDA
jgi:hypothetical protein